MQSGLAFVTLPAMGRGGPPEVLLMVGLKARRESPRMLAALALAFVFLTSSAASQQPAQNGASSARSAVVAKMRQVITQEPGGAPAVARSVSRSMPVVGGRTQIVTDDPVPMGKLENKWKLEPSADMPVKTEPVEDGNEKEDTGAFAALENVKFAPVVEEELLPGTHRETQLAVQNVSVLLGSAQWIGTNSPMNVTLSVDGVTLAEVRGVGHDNRGTAVLKAKSAAPGLVTLSVTNTSGSAARVKLVLGALPQ
jgi:hypothetical protein